MTIRATKVGHAIAPHGKEIATFILRYPRWIHAEGRTHRQLSLGEDELPWELRTPSLMEDENLSRNASSSRAVPVEKLIQDVIDDTAMPVFWGKNQKGMQAEEENDEMVWISYDQKSIQVTREEAIQWGRDMMIALAQGLTNAGYHKQLANRYLEPFSHINVIVTATEWSNFFALRRHSAAEPHIHLLADAIYTELKRTPPVRLDYDEWYLPMVSDQDLAELGTEGAIKLSVARCASISYKTVDGLDMDMQRAVALYQKLLGAHPIHASPAEHQALPDKNVGNEVDGDIWAHPEEWGNFKGFRQYRKMIPGECL